MTDWILALLLILTAVTATVVALTREPGRQAVVLSAYGILLGMVMLALAAPDVALSQIGVGTAAVPLIVVLALTRSERAVRDHEAAAGERSDERAGERPDERPAQPSDRGDERR